MKIVLATGQSNMLGAGEGGLAMDSAPVTVWNNTNDLGANGTAWIPSPAEGNSPWRTAGGNNLALWFCARLARETNEEVRLILVAKSGTPIADWAPPSGILYAEILAVWAAANPGRAADVYLWHQGEGDSLTPEATYKAAWLNIRSSLISAGILSSSTLSVIGGLKTVSDVKHQNLAAENADKIAFAPASDLPVYDVTTHFTGSALCTLGYDRFWRAYASLTGPKVIQGSLPFPGS